MKPSPVALRRLAACAALLALPAAAHAQSVQAWGDVSPYPSPNPLIGDWDAGGPLFIGNTSFGSLEIRDSATVSSTLARIDNGGQVEISSGRWENSGDVYIGYQGEGWLTSHDGGSMISANASIGHLAGSVGNVTFRYSVWINQGDLFVGKGGTGTLTVADSGSVITRTLYASMSSLQGDGSITANGVVLDSPNMLRFDRFTYGPNQTLNFGNGGRLKLQINGDGALGVGYRGQGDMQILEGRQIESSTGILGMLAGSVGTATVYGEDSEWSIRTGLYVGQEGRGTLLIAEGGKVSSAWGSINSAGGAMSIAYLEGTDSRWINTHHLIVGETGNAQLQVTEGSRVESGSGILGSGAGSNGDVRIRNAGSAWAISGDLQVGVEGTGALRIESGGLVSNATAHLGADSGGTGSAIVTGAGSTWTNGDLHIGENGTGSLTVADGGSVTTTGALTLYGAGDSLALDGGTVTAGGGVYVLADAVIGGDGTINGDLSFASGAKLVFNINTTLAINGAVSLDSSFGIASLLGLDASIADGSYTLMTSTETLFGDLNLQNWGYNNRFDLGDNKAAYFSEGSLEVNIITVPEPAATALVMGAAALLALSTRRRLAARAPILEP